LAELLVCKRRIAVQNAQALLNLDPVALALVIGRTLVVYFVLLIALRLAGKRALSQMTPFDLVVLLIIANAVQNAMVGADVSLNAGLVAALALLLVDRLVGWLTLRPGRLAAAVTGSPTLLIHDGQLLMDHLRAEGLTEAEVLQALREHGVDDVAAVKNAVLEIDGTISVIARDAPSTHTRRRLRARKGLLG
jgi:uncharacterized membrane protein YcaP (DUF421 family)